MSEKHTPMYPDIHPETIADDYTAHMHAMTDESLYAKSDIAVQLAWRDVEIRRLSERRDELLAVLQELEESSAHWSEYDVPIGIVERIRDAITKATGHKGENL